jgi:TolB-like protein
MKSPLRSKIATGLLLAILQTSAGICQNTTAAGESGDQRGVVVLPFEIRGLSPEQGAQLRARFIEGLSESKHLDVLPDDVMKSMLAEANLHSIDSCNTLPCLAQLGKVLHVEDVIHVSVDRWEERYILLVRLVRSSDAALLYNERTDYTGELNNFMSVVTPEQGRKLGYAYLDKSPNWYLIAAAVLVGVGLIYWIYTTWAASSSSQTDNTPTPTTGQ